MKDSRSYSEYLQSPEWRELRKKAIARAEGRCQLCNSDEQLEVHHRKYSTWGKEPLSDLTVLCRSCHVNFTRIVQKKRASLKRKPKIQRMMAMPKTPAQEVQAQRTQSELKARLEKIRERHGELKPRKKPIEKGRTLVGRFWV